MTTSRLCSTSRLGLFDDHLGHLYMSRCRLIKSRADDLTFYRPLHVRYFFWALVDQKNYQGDFRMIRSDGISNGLQQHRLAGPRWSDDQAALSLAYRCQQVCDPTAGIFVNRLHLDAFLRIERGQVIEENLVPCLFRRLEINRLDFHQGKIFFPFMRRTHVAADRIACLEIEFTDLRGRDVNVVRPREIVIVRRTKKAVPVGKDFKHPFGKDVTFFFALGLEDLEDKILFSEAAGARDFEGARDAAELRYVLFF